MTASVQVPHSKVINPPISITNAPISRRIVESISAFMSVPAIDHSPRPRANASAPAAPSR